jgi:predicted ATPase/DNA-binding CsgD family transcriptional regulator
MTSGSLVGRDDDVATCLESLASGEQWISVVGPGGAGKTTLAREVQRQWAMGGGTTWFVACDQWSDATTLMSFVAEQIGAEVSGGDVAHVIARLFVDGDALLVLDNLEHVADAFGDIAALVVMDERIRLVCTSRVAARLPGERVQSLAGLGSAAPELLVRRIQAAGVALSDSDNDDVAALCDLVDRLPLGIELAAVRVPAFGIKGLIDVLGAGLRTLDGSRPHRKNNSVIDCVADSYRLMSSPDAQLLYRRLGVLSSEFSLDTVTAMVPEVERCSVALANLVDVHLVVRISDAPTYRMLASVREHALELLEQSGERPGAEDLLLARVHALVAIDDPDDDVEYPKWLARVAIDYAVARDALAVARQRRDGAVLTFLIDRLRVYWYPSNMMREAYTWATTAVQLGHDDPPERARQFFHLGGFAYSVEGAVGALRYQRQALALVADDSSKLRALILGNIADMLVELGEFEEGEALCRQAKEQHEVLGMVWFAAAEELTLGRVQLLRDYPDSALSHFEHAAAVFGEIGEIRGTETTRSLIAEAYLAMGHADRAVVLLDAAIEGLWAVGDRREVFTTMALRVDALMDLGRPDEARARAAEIDVLEGAGDDLSIHCGVLLSQLRALAPTLDQLDVHRRLSEAIALCHRLKLLPPLVTALELGAELATNVRAASGLAGAANGLRSKHSMRRNKPCATRLGSERCAVAPQIATNDEITLLISEMFATNGTDVSTQPAVDSGSGMLIDPLTGREQEVLVLMAKGLRDKDIATQLYLSVRTVNGYVARVFTKLDVTNRVSAIAAARRYGLLE